MKLTFKITTLVTLILILLLSIFGYFIIQNEKKFIITLQQKQSKAIVNTISTSIVDAVLLKDYPVMETILKQTAGAYDNIKTITIEQNKKILAQYSKNDYISNYTITLNAPVKIGDEVIANVIIIISNEENFNAIQERIFDFILLVIFISIIIIIVLIITIKYFLIDKINYIKEETSNITLANLQERIIINSNDELHDLSENINIMTEKLHQEIEENKNKDRILHEQGKMASMGEMIGNIAHQWRQPLSAISSSASSIKLFSQMDMLEKEKLEHDCDDIVDKAQYLSQTIEIFRNFLKDDKEFKIIDIKESIDIVFSIIGSSLKNNLIDIRKTFPSDEIKIPMITGELEQVLINILNNAKDVIVDKKIEKPKILFNVEKKLDTLFITIEDNAGGVPEDIIHKIFEPYFTTKHQSRGTGLGLHMSYKIITESLKGKLYVQNTKIGAKFFIEIPIKTM